MIGAVLLGLFTDKTKGSRRSPLALASIFIAFLIGLFFFVFDNSAENIKLYGFMMFFYGFFLGSVSHLIILTVAADLGRSHSKQATATITGIIDGIGSTGNGLGQLCVGGLIDAFGWRYGFLLTVALAIGLTLLPLLRIFCNEQKTIIAGKKRVLETSE